MPRDGVGTGAPAAATLPPHPGEAGVLVQGEARKLVQHLPAGEEGEAGARVAPGTPVALLWGSGGPGRGARRRRVNEAQKDPGAVGSHGVCLSEGGTRSQSLPQTNVWAGAWRPRRRWGCRRRDVWGMGIQRMVAGHSVAVQVSRAL